MGSYKGLSFFNPKQLTKSNLKVVPKFTSISVFNSKKGIWERNISPNSLNNLKTITLPPEYQRFITTTSIFGQVNPKNFKFSLFVLELKKLL